MTLSQRPCSRVCTAFNAWRHSTPPPLCSLLPRVILRKPPYLYGARDITATALTREKEQAERKGKASIYTDQTVLFSEPPDRSANRLIEDSDKPLRSFDEGLVSEDDTFAARMLELEDNNSHTNGTSLNAQAQESVPHATTVKAGIREEDTYTAEKDSKLREHVREIMRNVPQPVCVISAVHIDPDIKKPVPLGVAVSSFNTVTLNPPTVSFNIRCPSRTLDAIRADNGFFRVSLVKGDNTATKLVDSYTKGNSTANLLERMQHRYDLTLHPDRKNSLLPITNATLDCEIMQEVPVADHSVVIAKVLSAKRSQKPAPSFYYERGHYRSSHGKPILHNRSEMAGVDLPEVGTLIRGLNSGNRRSKVKAYIEDVLAKRPEILDMELETGATAVHKALCLPPWAYSGVSILGTIIQVARAQGRTVEVDLRQHQSPFFEFYSPLSPTGIATVVERIKGFLKADPAFLSIHHHGILQLLSIDPQSRDLLASDLLSPLRAEGVLPPFNPQAKVPDSIQSSAITLEHLELFEHQTIKLLRNKIGTAARSMSFKDLADAIGAKGMFLRHLQRIHCRLLGKAFPLPRHDDGVIYLEGHLSNPYTHVILYRMLDILQMDKNKQESMSVHAILQSCKVDPLITGVDLHFLFEKTRWYMKNEKNRPKGLREMRRSEFILDTTLEDFKKACFRIVQDEPHLAATLSHRNTIAAMGFWPEIKIVADDGAARRKPADDGLLNEYLREAFVSKYIEGNQEPETEAVAKRIALFERSVEEQPRDWQVKTKTEKQTERAQKRSDTVQRLKEGAKIHYHSYVEKSEGGEAGTPKEGLRFTAYGLDGSRQPPTP